MFKRTYLYFTAILTVALLFVFMAVPAFGQDGNDGALHLEGVSHLEGAEQIDFDALVAKVLENQGNHDALDKLFSAYTIDREIVEKLIYVLKEKGVDDKTLDFIQDQKFNFSEKLNFSKQNEPTLVDSFPWSEDFATYLPTEWTELAGILADPTDFGTSTSSFWRAETMGNQGSSCAGFNLWDSDHNEWMFTPQLDLGTGGDFALEFDLALTTYNSTISSTLDSDDKVAVVISTDGGTTWSSTNVLQQWDDSTPISNGDGDHISIDLSSYSGVIMIGFYAESTFYDGDNDLFVDNVTVGEPAPRFSDSSKTAPSITWAGEKIAYTILITNSGNLTAENVSITDPKPSGANQDSLASVTLLGDVTQTSFNSAFPISWEGSIPPGSGVEIVVDVEVVAPEGNIITNTATISDPVLPDAIEVVAGTTVVLDPTVTSLPWSEDFEISGAGFTPAAYDLASAASATSKWEWGQPTNGPGSAHSGDNVWATDLNGYFDDTITDTLTSPKIDLSSYSDGELLWVSYYDWRDHYANAENAYFLINSTTTNGWTQIWTDHYGQKTWTQHSYEISQYVSPGDELYLRFVWEGNNNYETSGWYIDDVAVELIEPAPDFSSSSKSAPSTAEAGDYITYTLTITNSGVLTASNVSIDDALPAGVTLVGTASVELLGASQVTFTNTNPIQWTGSIPPASGLVITIPVQLPTTFDVIITNTATISDPILAEIEELTSVTTIPPDPTITSFPWLEDWENTDGDNYYGWALKNLNGDGDYWSVGSGSYYHSYNHYAMLHTDYNSSNDDWLVTPPLALSGDNSLSFWARAHSFYEPEEVAVLLSTTDTQTSSFTTVMPSTVIDFTTYQKFTVDLSAYDGQTVYIAFVRRESPVDGWWLYLDDISVGPPAPDFSMSTKSAPSTASLGDIITYTLTITNSGVLTASNVTISDTLPSGVSINGTASVELLGASQVTFTNTNPIQWTGSIPPASGLVITIPVQVDSAGLTITNTATISDPALAEVVEISDSTDVSVSFAGSTKSVNNTFVNYGDEITYTIRIINSGHVSSTNGRMYDAMPVGVEINSATITPTGRGTLSNYTDSVEWLTSVANPLAVSEDVTIKIRATVTGGAVSGFVNTATITDTMAEDDKEISSRSVSIADNPTIALYTTVGTEAGVCATEDAIIVVPGTEVYYCYKVVNDSSTPITLTTHSLDDTALGALLTNHSEVLTQTEVYTHVESATISSTVINTATWTATNLPFYTAVASDTATVTVMDASLVVTPTTLSSLGQFVNSEVTNTLTISNTGSNDDLTWSVYNATVPNGDCTPLFDMLWLSLSPSSGTISPSSDIDSIVTFDSNGIAPDTYTGNLCLISNDVTNPAVSIPITMTVTGPSLVLNKTVSVGAYSGLDTIDVASGQMVTYWYEIENNGTVTLTAESLYDDQLGDIPVSGNIVPGDVVTFTKSISIYSSVTNMAAFTATSVITDELNIPTTYTTTDTSEQAIVNILVPSITLAKTVGTDPAVCADTTEIEVAVGTDVTYCYAAENTGTLSFTLHSLVDDKLGTLLTNEAIALLPGETTIFTETVSATVDVTNVATWTATGAFTNTASATATATVDVNDATIDVDPESMESTLDFLSTETQELTISNDGTTDSLTWEIIESLPPEAQGRIVQVVDNEIDEEALKAEALKAGMDVDAYRERFLIDEITTVKSDGEALVLVINDGGYNSNQTRAFTQALTNLGFTYDVATSANFLDMTIEELLAYQVVLYAGSPSHTASLEAAQAMFYLDAGGQMLIADNDFGYNNRTTVGDLYANYLEADYVADGGSKGIITGTNLMAGLNVDISSDPYPDDFIITGTNAIGIFDAPSGNLAGSLIEKDGYKAIYFAWDYHYLGGLTIGDQAETDVLQQALAWFGVRSDIPWVSTNPISGTTVAASDTAIDVVFNANGLEPGQYHANLLIESNDLATPVVTVPLTLDVTMPTNYGALEGTVSSLGYCDAELIPLAGTDVIISGASPMTVTTDVSGTYMAYLPAGSHTVDTAPDGHESGTADIAITAGVTTTQDFALRSIEPCLDVEPTSFDVTLEVEMSVTELLTFTNAGAGDGFYTFDSLGVLVVHDYNNDATNAFTETLTTLGYNYLVANEADVVATDIGTLLAFDAIIWAGYPAIYSTGHISKAMEYLDAGGRLLIADNDFGYGDKNTDLYQDYFEASYIADSGSKGLITGTDIMEGLSVDLSNASYPDDFVISATTPSAVGIFDSKDGNLAGSRIEKDGYKAIYFAWDFEDTGLITDTILANVLEPALEWLIDTTEISWLSVDPINGAILADGGANANLTFTAPVTEGVYTTTLMGYTNDAVMSVVEIPVTMNVEASQTVYTPSIALVKTVSVDGSCGTTDVITVTEGAEVTYCYTAENTGDVMLDSHTVTDTYAIGMDAFTYELEPGATKSVTVSVVISEETTSTGYWLAENTTLSLQAEDSDTTIVYVESVTQTEPELSVSPVSLSGILNPETVMTKTVTFSNTGTADGTFTFDVVTETWLAVDPTSDTVAADSTVDVDVIFTAPITNGTYLVTLTGTTDDADMATYEIDVTMVVTSAVLEPELSVVYESMDVELNPEATVTKVVTITNSGLADATFVADVTETWLSVDPTNGTVIADNGVTTVDVIFIAPLTEDTYTTNLVITTDDSNLDTVTIPVTMTVSEEIVIPPVSSIELVKTVGTDSTACATTTAIEVDDGTEVFYCFTVENTGEITFTQHSISDDMLNVGGPIFITDSLEIAPGNTYSYIYMTPTVVTADTVNEATWVATDNDGLFVMETAIATVTIESVTPNPDISLLKTVGTDATACADTTSITVDEDATVHYCLQVENTGDVSFNTFTAVDGMLGINLSNVTYDLAPGESAFISTNGLTTTETIAGSAIATTMLFNSASVIASDGTYSAASSASTIVKVKTITPTGLSSIRVSNNFASEGTFKLTILNSVNIDFNVDDETKVSSLPYGITSDYVPVSSTIVKLDVLKSGTNDIIQSTVMTPTDSMSYTMVAVGGANDHDEDILMVTDTPDTMPSAGTGLVRIIHAAPFAEGDNATLDIKYSDGTDFYPNLEFGQDTGYQELTASSTYTLTAVNATATITVPAFTLEDGQILTYYLRGGNTEELEVSDPDDSQSVITPPDTRKYIYLPIVLKN